MIKFWYIRNSILWTVYVQYPNHQTKEVISLASKQRAQKISEALNKYYLEGYEMGRKDERQQSNNTREFGKGPGSS